MGIDEESLGESVLSVQEVGCQRRISSWHQTIPRRRYKDVTSAQPATRV
jgi:hypothetical protein